MLFKQLDVGCKFYFTDSDVVYQKIDLLEYNCLCKIGKDVCKVYIIPDDVEVYLSSVE